MMSEKQRLLRRIKRGEKITGQAAIIGHELGLGDLRRSENSELYLSTIRLLGIRTPCGKKQKMY